MLGLAVLFALGLWLLVTIVAMVIGRKLAVRWIKKPYASLVGIFAGFMLTMGGFIVHWRIEYLQIQSHVTHLCKTEAGITTYVTPEEWESGHFQATNPVDISIVNDGEIIFQGNRYRESTKQINSLFIYSSIDSNWARQLYTQRNEDLLYDKEHNLILMKVTYFSVPFSVWSGNKGAYKVWIEAIQACTYENLEPFWGKIDLYNK